MARAWEVMTPSPPPEGRRDATDPRITRAERQLRRLDRLALAFKAIHPLGAGLPLECMAITSHTFAGSPKDKHGPHAYSLAAFGLDPDHLRRCFKAYGEHFRIQPEPDPV